MVSWGVDEAMFECHGLEAVHVLREVRKATAMTPKALGPGWISREPQLVNKNIRKQHYGPFSLPLFNTAICRCLPQ